MRKRRWISRLVWLAVLAAPAVLAAQFTSPNVLNIVGDVGATLGGTVFVNHGLVGVGRISATQPDPFGESFGSASGMQITNWSKTPGGAFQGTLNILPDRGYNNGNYFANYAARIQQVNFTFTPYTGSADIGGTTDAEKIAAQNQIAFGPTITGTRLTYLDPTNGLSFTTGLDPGPGFTTLFGKTVPYVINYRGARKPGDLDEDFPNINKLPIDAEALVLRPDGSGWIGDEYGANVYFFNSSKQIIGVIVPPSAMQPHHPSGTPFYGGAPNPDNGRRPNQGIEGVGLSPDGSRLFVPLQSGTMQDSGSANQTRRNTRLLVYDVSTNPVPDAPILEYALTLPTYRGNGNGGAPSNLNNTCQQSEVIVIDNTRFLVLPRDGNGLGSANNNQSVYKTVILVDLTVGQPTPPTEFSADGARNMEGGIIATVSSTSSDLLAGITPLSWIEAVNILNRPQLTKFNIALDTGNTVTKLTLGEKWEGLALVPALDPAAPDDYFLFVGNDNDFLTSSGLTRGPDPLDPIWSYNGFAAHPAARIPPPVGSPTAPNESDTVVLAFRVTITKTPTTTRSGFVLDRRTMRFNQQVTLTNTTGTPLTGPIFLAVDDLSFNATLSSPAGTTTKNAPLGSPYVQVVPPGVTLAPGGIASVVLQFTNPTMAPITYTARVLVLTGPVTP